MKTKNQSPGHKSNDLLISIEGRNSSLREKSAFKDKESSISMTGLENNKLNERIESQKSNEEEDEIDEEFHVENEIEEEQTPLQLRKCKHFCYFKKKIIFFSPKTLKEVELRNDK